MKSDFTRRSFAIFWVLALTLGSMVAQILTHENEYPFAIPVLIIFALVGLMGLCWPHFDYEDLPEKPVRLMRRFTAACIDIHYIVILVLVPTLTLRGLILLSFGRNFSLLQPDNLQGVEVLIEIIAVLFFYAVMFLYFLHSLKTGERTLGQRLLNFRIETTENSALAKRIWLGAWAMAWGLITAAACANAPPGRYYWDEKSRTRAVSTRTV